MKSSENYMKRFCAIVLTVAAILLTGCDGDPAKARVKYLESGNKYFANGKFREASIMYRRSLQKDMRFAEAHYRLGLSELRLGRIVDSMRSFQRAVELDPKNLDAPAKLADIYLAAYAQDPRRPQQYLKEIEELAKRLMDRDPNSYDGLRLKGYLALARNQPAEGVAFFEKANQIKPNQNETQLVLIQSLIATNRWPEAEKLAKGMIARDKNYTPPYDILYAKYMQDKREEEAEATMRMKADNNPRSVEFTQQLAAHYYIKGRRPDMLSALDRLLKNPKEFPQGRLAVGQFYFRIRELDNAMEQFNKGVQESPRDKAMYQRRMVEVLVLQGKKTEATQLVESILKADSKDNEALAMRASLMLQSGNKEQIQAAVNDLQSVVSRMPENAVVRFNLARALIAKNDLDAAKVQLQEAIKARPDYVLARLALAQVQIAKQDYSSAVQTANQALQFDPNNVAAKLLKTAAMLSMKDFRTARTELEDMLDRNPNLPDAQFQLGRLNLEEKKYAEAERIFRGFYKNSPTDPRSLPSLVETLAVQGSFDAALQLVRDEIAKAPDRLDLRVILASTAARANKLGIAEEEYRGLLNKNPRSADLHMRLGQIMQAKGDLDGALASYEKARELVPGDVQPYVFKALIFEQKGQAYQAMPIYQEIMKRDPENAVALNNVAYIMAENGKDLDEALNLATKARQKMPNNPDVNDTLGWIYIKKNLSDQAIMIFRELSEKYPNRATYRYHLGMALFQKGDKPRAKKELEIALANKPDKVEEGKIRELLAKL